MESTTVMIANKDSWKDEWKQKNKRYSSAFKGALNAGEKVGLKMNIPEKNWAASWNCCLRQKAHGFLPIGRKGEEQWVAIEVIMDEK